ncbi:MAG: hypothetical protein ACFE75_12945, partial [Candidatus Hodarchaeota archaeon]
TSKDLLDIIIYYINHITNQKIEDPLIFIKKILKFLEFNYFSPFIEHYLQKNIWQNRFFVYLGSLLIQFYENFQYIRSFRNHNRFKFLNNLFSKKSPIIKIYCGALSILFSINYPERKEQFIKNANELLKQIYPLEIQQIGESQLDYLRNVCIKAHKLYNLKKIKKTTF